MTKIRLRIEKIPLPDGARPCFACGASVPAETRYVIARDPGNKMRMRGPICRSCLASGDLDVCIRRRALAERTEAAALQAAGKPSEAAERIKFAEELEAVEFGDCPTLDDLEKAIDAG